MDANIKYEEEFITNKDGLKLLTCRWLPERKEGIKALVFFCHGYAMETSITMQDPAKRLASAGYGVYGIDYIGHGRSEGLHGYIHSFNSLVDDCSQHFTNVCEREENKNKRRYLMGESMGGAVTLYLHKKKPDFWDGAVLIAPMCKLADGMKPNPMVANFLSQVCKVVPKWKIIPSSDIIDIAVRCPEAKKRVRSNPYWYTDRPRLKTGQELYNVTLEIEKSLAKVKLPFIVLHGGGDKVTDPSVSKLLFETASSTDKTFKLYDGMWHALSYGELQENIDIVFTDIIAWLDERTVAKPSTTQVNLEDDDQEKERKLQAEENTVDREKERKLAEDVRRCLSKGKEKDNTSDHIVGETKVKESINVGETKDKDKDNTNDAEIINKNMGGEIEINKNSIRHGENEDTISGEIENKDQYKILDGEIKNKDNNSVDETKNKVSVDENKNMEKDIGGERANKDSSSDGSSNSDVETKNEDNEEDSKIKDKDKDKDKDISSENKSEKIKSKNKKKKKNKGKDSTNGRMDDK